MKNKLLFLLLTCLSLPVFGAKEYTLEIHVIDIYTGKPISDVQVSVFNKSGGVEKGRSNRIGIVIFPEIRGNWHRISTDTGDNYYMEKDFEYMIPKKGMLDLFLYPSDETLKEWTMEEDEEYGNAESGVLDPRLNSGGLIYGCELDELTDSEFPEGMAAMQKFISENVRYPEESIWTNSKGKVYLMFVVEADGKISHVAVEQGVDPYLNAEAIRLVRTMPLWSPCRCDGEAIRSLARLPINFTLK